LFNWSKISNEIFIRIGRWWKIIIDITSIIYIDHSYLIYIFIHICQYQTDWNIETADEKNEEKQRDILSIYDIFEREENNEEEKEE
jgi:hypothetical protein